MGPDAGSSCRARAFYLLIFTLHETISVYSVTHKLSEKFPSGLEIKFEI